MDRELPWLYDSPQEITEENALGGIWTVDGWEPARLLDEGFDRETDIHPSFDSGWEALEFVMGRERYSDTNSFFYTPEDGAMVSDEGFFQDVYCPRCVEDAVDVDIEDEIDPVIEPFVTDETRKSYKHGTEAKEVTSTRYSCSDHPEVYMSVSESEYV